MILKPLLDEHKLVFSLSCRDISKESNLSETLEVTVRPAARSRSYDFHGADE